MAVADPHPTRLGPYHVLDLLARGRLTDVYAGRRSVCGGVVQTVALKVLRPSAARDPEQLGDFLREVRVAGCVSHPNLVQVFDAGEHRGRYYAAMELVVGRTLAALIEASAAPLPTAAALAIVQQLADGAHHVHQASGSAPRPLGLVHGGIAPDNVMVTAAGRVTLFDFGAAASGRAGARPGSLARVDDRFAAPELLRGAPVTPAADVYALGMVLQRLLGAAGDLVTPPPALTGVVARAIDPQARRRFRSARDLYVALDDVARDLALDATAETVAQAMRVHVGGGERRRSRTAVDRRRPTSSRYLVAADPITVA